MHPPGLTYYPDSNPGITRRRAGRGWSYRMPDGTTIDDAGERARINALAVPPAYEKVWICPIPHGHLQATGYDARTRKQYRYHPEFRDWQEQRKYDQLAAFGAALPRIRRRVREDLKGEAGERDFAIAAVIALIDEAAIRVGHADYTVENRTYGATTLTRRHLKLGSDTLRLKFNGKGGKPVDTVLKSRTLQKVFAELHDLPGKSLISWVDDEDQPHAVHSGEVNARLSEIVEVPGITAKTFRTWAGSEAALDAAARAERLTIKILSEAAAKRLSNTPSIARNSYIHPAVIALAEGEGPDLESLFHDLPETSGLRKTERALLRLLS